MIGRERPLWLGGNAKALGAFQYIGPVAAGKITLCKTEIMNGVEQVGLAAAVEPANAGNTPRERKRGLGVIFELEQRYGGKGEQGCKISRKLQATSCKSQASNPWPHKSALVA